MAAETGNMLTRFTEAARKGLGIAGRNAKPKEAAKASADVQTLGLLGVNMKSDAAAVEDYAKRLYHEQDDLLEERHREWRQILLYCANEQAIAYHRDRRTWIPKKTLPWRVRSTYNVTQRAVNVRVGRLVENKPTVTVQAQTASPEDIQKAEYKENLFWYLWERLYLHLKITRARRWATKTGSGFLKVGWDPDAGASYPATRKRMKFSPVEQPVLDPMGQPTGMTQPQQVFDGVEEYYIDAKGNDLGPVLETVTDEEGETTSRRREPPDDVLWITEGEAYVDVPSPFGIRFDRYVDDISESWYVQDARVVPLSKIAAAFPDKLEILQQATPASEDDKALGWTGLTQRTTPPEAGGMMHSGYAAGDGTSRGKLDEDYLVVETWIFPKNGLIKKLWGRKGALIITVGGKEVHRSALPEWALRACPFVQLVDVLEEGNHYAKSSIRDILPLQDDLNRTRSMQAERLGIASRLILTAPANHGMNVRAIAGMNGALVTVRSQAHKPDVLKLDTGDPGLGQYYQETLAAIADVGNMNDASSGKLPSAGLAAKAIFALQYADERSVAETSTLQDIALKRLAEALDAVTREEYTEPRKIRLVGDDRSFLVEHEIRPEDLAVDVDYTFQPGSMLARQKEAVKNEILSMLEAKLISPDEARKAMPTAVPDVFRRTYDLQEARARRNLSALLKGSARPVQPAPFDNPGIHLMILEEFMLSAKFEILGKAKQDAVSQLWQAYKVMQANAQAAAAAAAAPAVPGAPPPEGGAPVPAPGPEGGVPTPAEGAQQLEQQAVTEMEPPAEPEALQAAV